MTSKGASECEAVQTNARQGVVSTEATLVIGCSMTSKGASECEAVETNARQGLVSTEAALVIVIG